MTVEDASTPPPIFGTFGIYRFFLAMLVIVTHVAPQHWAYAGEYAVFAFFVLSGYVVSYILTYDYLRKPLGLRKYFLNRALRVYPTYWLVCLLFFLWLYVTRSNPQNSYYGYLSGSSFAVELGWWGFTLTLLTPAIPFIYIAFRPVFIPPTLSVGIELCYWMLIPAMLLKPGLRKVIIALAVTYTLFGACLTIYMGPQSNIYPVQLIRYYLVMAGALPFCLGVMLLRAKARREIQIPHIAGLAAIAAFSVLLCSVNFMFSDAHFQGAYLSLALNALIVAYLSRFDQRQIPAWLSRADNFLGSLAYPVFLIHLPVIIVLQKIMPSLPFHTFTFYLMTVLVSIPSACLLHYGVEVPVGRLRHAIKC